MDDLLEKTKELERKYSKRKAGPVVLEKGQLKNLPKSLQEIESEIEAAAERAAIQEEAKP